MNLNVGQLAKSMQIEWSVSQWKLSTKKKKKHETQLNPIQKPQQHWEIEENSQIKWKQ